jgi:hypothetical protein
MVPRQRKSGQFGGDGGRSNRRAFRASGGVVKPPSKSCGLLAVLALLTGMGLIAISVVGFVHVL